MVITVIAADSAADFAAGLPTLIGHFRFCCLLLLFAYTLEV
jgi:hypothetical protein